MGIEPIVPRDDPRIQRAQQAVVDLAAAHVSVADLFPVADGAARRDGQITATWVGRVLIVSADGECAEDLEALLVAGLLAKPERVA